MQRNTDISLPTDTPPDFNWLDYAIEQQSHYDPDSHCCQGCGKKLWAAKHTATYKRGFIWPRNGRPEYDEITVTVILCENFISSKNTSESSNTNYHHAILGGLLIPFTAYTVIFILTVLDSYFNRTGSVASVCKQWEITSNTLYKWKKRFLDHYHRWISSESDKSHFPSTAWRMTFTENTADNFLTVSMITEDLSLLQDIIPGFFSFFGFSFLQGCRKKHLKEAFIN